MSLRAVDHVGYTVADLDRASEWYTRLLGEEPVVRTAVGPGYIGAIVGYPDCRMEWALWQLPNGSMLELIQYLEPAATQVDMETSNVGNGHLCLVTDDLDGDCERMAGHAALRSPAPVEISAGPYQGARVLYMRDPDGITVELIELPAADQTITA